MGDNITIGVTEIVNNIEVTAQPNDQIVDISVTDNADNVTLNITPTVVEVNINKGGSFAKWGDLYGTLSDQTDLQNALNLKANLVGGKVPASELPSYVDDIIEVANYAALPATGEIGKIYVTLDNNKIYRWSGSVYIEIASNSAIWGAITGTLGDQTDLQNALNAKQNALTNPVTGTGTTNYIPKFTGSTAIGNSNITDNGTVVSISTDASINSVNIGLGRGAIATNTRVGASALNANTTGTNNAAFGHQSLLSNTTGGFNTAFGASSLRINTTGSINTAVGSEALYNNNGGQNTAVGVSALYGNTTGGQNIALGRNAGRHIADGTTANTISNNSIFLGFGTKALADNQTNQIVIGYNVVGLGSNTTVLGNSSTTTTAIYGNVLIGTTTDAGYKLDVNGTLRVSGQVTSTTNFYTASISDTLGSRTFGGNSFSIRNNVAEDFNIDVYNRTLGAWYTPFIIKNTGNVGIGTTSTVQKLTIGDGTGTGNQYIRIHASASDMYIGQTGSNLFGAGNGQVIVTDVTYTSNLAIGTLNSSANLVFGTASTERMRITSGGNVLIGTTTDVGFKLDVNGNVRATGFFNSSDNRLKDLTDYDYNVSDIKPITYLWKDGRDNKKHVGYSAQQVQKVMPDAVNEDDKGFLSVNYVEVLVAQVELLNNRMAEMQKEIELLKSK
jgi:uncharacterized protein YaiE (UPF0345 family)